MLNLKATPAVPHALITFEGDDGSGKSTVIEHLKPWLATFFDRPIDYLREPGGTKVAEQIRHVLLTDEAFDDRAELLLYEAARAQLVHQKIIPALKAGHLVICDRFIDSTNVYQGMPDKTFDQTMITALNQFATHDLIPDLTIYLHLDPQVGQSRRQLRGGGDRFDRRDLIYHRLIEKHYQQLAYHSDRIVEVDANNALDMVVERVKTVIEHHFSN